MFSHFWQFDIQRQVVAHATVNKNLPVYIGIYSSATVFSTRIRDRVYRFNINKSTFNVLLSILYYCLIILNSTVDESCNSIK